MSVQNIYQSDWGLSQTPTIITDWGETGKVLFARGSSSAQCGNLEEIESLIDSV